MWPSNAWSSRLGIRASGRRHLVLQFPVARSEVQQHKDGGVSQDHCQVSRQKALGPSGGVREVSEGLNLRRPE